MNHADICREAERWVADAEAKYPGDRVKQAVMIVENPPNRYDAYLQAISDLAFDAVFRYMTDEEAQVWSIYCLYDGVRPMADARMAYRSAKHTKPMQVAA